MYRLFLLFCLGLFVSCTIDPGSKCASNDDCLSSQVCFRGFCNELTGKCAPGETRPCPGGSTETRGICKPGVVKCQAEGSWSTVCEGEIRPGQEVCDGQDNDCDGKVDNLPGGAALTRSCYSGPANTQGKGACKAGTQTCKDGKWTNCEGEVQPKREVCGNQVDDDCDGSVDNVPELGKPCTRTANTPECRTGTSVCGAGGTIECRPNTRTRECNGKDDDCDGQIDVGCDCKPPGVTRPCGENDTGACKKGVQRCVNGTWAPQCEGEVKSKAEVCNGMDDNCDGHVDNRPGSPQPLFRPCYTGPAGTQGKGPCKEGRQVCVNGKYSDECGGQVVPVPELCGNQIDDNCDGLVDNVRDLGQACLDDTRKGRCRGGVYRCWGTQRICLAQAPYYKAPISEECNGLDDDCDGFVDNAVKGGQDLLSQPCGSDVGLCQKGKKLCVLGQWSNVCQGETAPSPEICNQKDDDCDGQTDENGVCNTCTSGQVQSCFNGPTSARNIGRCKDGTELCSQSKWSGQCIGAVLPKTEDCNGLDDDCDGRVDNQRGTTLPLQQSCYDGQAATRDKGTCASGVRACANGAWSTCKWQRMPETELCDNKDNNCDGKVDEDFVCFGTSRKLFESCSQDNNALAYEKCGAGLICLKVNTSSPASFCYQTCTGDASCAGNKDGRTHCLLEPGSQRMICLAFAPSGAPCDEEQGILCETGAVCDPAIRRCRPPGIAPALGACGGETRLTCPSGYTCSYPTPGLPHGYCMQVCNAQTPCPSGVFCFLTSPTDGVCLPEGTQQQDQLCANPTGDKILANQYCAKNLFCYRPSATNPYGICAPFLATCQCPSDRLCLPAPGNTCLSLKKCGTCPAGQVCAQYGSTGNACAPAAPAGTVPFGGECTVTNRCLAGLLCFTAPGALKGHCTQVPCQSDSDCPSTPAGAKCQVVTQNLDKACVFPCQQDSDCPSNFTCDSQLNLCFPK